MIRRTLVPSPVPAAPPPPLRLPIGLHLDVSHEDYIADPCERPSLSSSIAQEITERSPFHAHFLHPRLGGGSRDDDSAAKGRGSILHNLVLGRGQDVVPIDAENFKTKAAREARDAAIAAGKVPVIAERYEELVELAELLRGRIRSRGVALAGESEVTAIWERNGVLCRGRYDHLTAPEFLIDDLKFCASASPEEITRKMISFGYDIQHAAYVDGLQVLIPDAVGRARMRFVFCEADPPHDVVVIEPAGTLRELGERKWKRARELWQRSLETNTWPGYAARVLRIEAPAWAVTRDDETKYNRMETNDNLPF